MSDPNAGARGSGVPGFTVTRWNLSLSLAIALAVLTGVFTLLWDETTTLRETQVELVSRVSGLSEQVSGLNQRVAGVERQIQDFREEVRADIRQLAELIRARGGPPGP